MGEARGNREKLARREDSTHSGHTEPGGIPLYLRGTHSSTSLPIQQEGKPKKLRKSQQVLFSRRDPCGVQEHKCWCQEQLDESFKNPMIAPSYYLERISRLQLRERKPTQSLANSVIAEMLLSPGQLAFPGKSAREKSVAQRDNSRHLQRAEYSAETDQLTCARKLLEAMGKNT